jgi:DNA processing protein
MMKGRDILLYLAIKYRNNWDAMYEAIKEKELINEEDLAPALEKIKGEVITIIDDNYPQEFKTKLKPPFVIFLSEEDKKSIGDDSFQVDVDTDEKGMKLEEFIVKMYVDDILWDEFELFAGSLKEAEDILESSDFEIEEAIPGAFYNALLLDAKGKELFRAEQLAGGDESDIEMFLNTVQFDIEPRNDNMGSMDA